MDTGSLWGPGTGVPDQGASFFSFSAPCSLHLPSPRLLPIHPVTKHS